MVKVPPHMMLITPTATPGNGEFKSISGANGGALSLPAGGTWAWFGFYRDSVTGIVSGINGGVSAGGIEIFTAGGGNLQPFSFVWNVNESTPQGIGYELYDGSTSFSEWTTANASLVPDGDYLKLTTYDSNASTYINIGSPDPKISIAELYSGRVYRLNFTAYTTVADTYTVKFSGITPDVEPFTITETSPTNFDYDFEIANETVNFFGFDHLQAPTGGDFFIKLNSLKRIS